MGLAVALTPLR